MPGVHKLASDSGHTYAWCAETRLRFGTYLCMVCINPPQIQGILMYGVHKYVPVLGHINEIPKWSDTNFIRANMNQ